MNMELIKEVMMMALRNQRPDNLNETLIDQLSLEEESKLLEILIEQRTCVLFYDFIFNNHLGEKFSKKFLSEIKDFSNFFIVNNNEIFRTMFLISKELQLKNIEHVFLKGPLLAEFYYEDHSLRPMRDLDILVKVEDIKPLLDLLESLNFSFLSRKGNKKEIEVSESFSYGRSHQMPTLISPFNTLLEIHHRVTKESDFPTCPLRDNTMKNSKTKLVNGRRINFPKPEDLFIHICEHSVIHHSFNNGFLVASDLSNLIRKGDLDWDYINSNINDRKLMKAVFLLLSILEKNRLLDKKSSYKKYKGFDLYKNPKETIKLSEDLLFISRKQNQVLKFLDLNLNSFRLIYLDNKSIGKKLKRFSKEDISNFKDSIVYLVNLYDLIESNLKSFISYLFNRRNYKNLMSKKNKLRAWVGDEVS